MLTPVTPPCYFTSTNQRIVHELITCPGMPLPQCAFKNALLKPMGISGVLSTSCPGLLA